jgi:HTH-type transcriptional repressor of NAD biosynthesis genes
VTSGLILGKFLPPHAGHLHLVRTALAEVDHLTVLVCSLASQPIPGELRAAWMRELVPGAAVIHITDENPSFPQEHPDFWNIWMQSIRRVLPEGPDLVYTSEDYGDELARRLNAQHRMIDPARRKFPVSGSLVRSDPDRYWEFIPPPVRPSFVAKVVLTGSESTGKTTLAQRLAAHFRTSWIPEYGRRYVEEHPGPLAASDIDPIARGQMASEEQGFREATRAVVMLDTDLVSTEVYAEHYFGSCPDWVREAARDRLGHLYLLTEPDVPWVPDPGQRDRADRRDEMDRLFGSALAAQPAAVVRIRGAWDHRFATAVSAVERVVSQGWPYRRPGGRG